MAQSGAERQEALRARRAILGMAEVRGLYLPVELHESFKLRARRAIGRVQRVKTRAGGSRSESQGAST